MAAIDTLRQLALSFPEATEQPHFEKPSFRVKNKIFATVDLAANQACVKLSEIDQNVFCTFDAGIIFPVPNKWGMQGWTFIDLNKVPEVMLADALTTAYCQVAPKKLALLVRPEEAG